MLYTQHLDSKPSTKTDKVKVNIFVFKVTLTIVFRNTYEIILCWTKYPYDDIFKGKDQNANDCDWNVDDENNVLMDSKMSDYSSLGIQNFKQNLWGKLIFFL